MVLKLRRAGAGELQRLDQVATHLNLRCRPDDDGFADAVIRAAMRKIRPIVEQANPATAEELVTALAEHLNVHFEAVRDPQDVGRIREHYLRRERQLGFAQLDDALNDPRTDALLFQLVPKTAAEETRYVAVLNLLRSAHREFWNKIHELAHRIVEPPQKLLPFKRHLAERKSPIERLVDIVAGEIGFYRPIFDPIVQRAAKKHMLTFNVVEAIKTEYAPSASLQSVANAVINRWPMPAMLVSAEIRGKRNGSRSDVALRAELQARNQQAVKREMLIYSNMRVPQTSPLFTAHTEQRRLDAHENLGNWDTSGGATLPSHIVLTSAIGFGDTSYAMLSLDR